MQYKNHDVQVIRKNNKNAYIRIKDDMVVVTVPFYYTDKLVEKLIDENSKSIDRMFNSYEKKKTFDEDCWMLGKKYYIIKTPLYDFEIVNDKIYVKDLKKLDKYLKTKREEIFSDRLDYWYNIFEEEIPYPNLRIRKMTTRWGVCNRKLKVVTLNSDLLKYDIEKLDYVIIHELSHFIHFNHSAKFWTLVSKYCPNYKNIRKELR